MNHFSVGAFKATFPIRQLTSDWLSLANRILKKQFVAKSYVPGMAIVLRAYTVTSLCQTLPIFSIAAHNFTKKKKTNNLGPL